MDRISPSSSDSARAAPPHLNRRFRVLHVLPWVGRGGVERRRVLLAQHLGPEFEQRVACLSGSGDVYDLLVKRGVAVHQLGTRGEGILNPLVHVRLHRLVREFRPDILHGAIFEGMTWGALAGLVQRTPVVLLEETSYPNDTSPIAMQRSSRGRALIHFFAGRSSGIVAVAPRIGDYLVNEVGIPKTSVHVILNGIAQFEAAGADAVRAERGRLGFSNDCIVLGGVGRVREEHKRFGDLLKVVARLRAHHDVRALIVGDGPDLPALKNRARELGVSEAVVFAGRREDRELFFGVMDIFVLSSSTEAAPLVLMEAMMAGRPCVATSVGGVPDIAVDGESALLVPAYEPERLGDAVRSVIENAALRNALAAQARQRAVKFLSAERYAAEVRALYLSKLERLRGRSHAGPAA